MKTIRIGVLGCGKISTCQHIGRFMKKDAKSKSEIVAVYDPKPGRAKKCLEENKTTAKICKSVEELLAEPIDAVVIATPNDTHCPLTLQAIAAGKHVFVEKPMAMNPAECKKMIAAAKKNKVKLSVGFQQRYNDKTTALIRARDEGRFGNIMFVKCQALRRRGVPNWGVFGQKELQGGGPMIDIGVHILECAHAFMGSPKPVAASGNIWTYMGDKPSTVRNAWPNWDYKTYTVEDLAIGQIRFENGAILQIESSFIAHIEKNDVFNFTAMGEKAGCSWEDTAIYTDENGLMVNMKPTYIGSTDAWGGLFRVKLQNWVDACTKGTPLGASGEAGLAVQKMLDGIYRSAAEGKEVTID